MLSQKRREMPRDGRFLRVRQTKLLQCEPRGGTGTRSFIKRALRKEAFEHELRGLVTGERGGERAAEQATSFARDADMLRLGRVVAEENFLRGAAGLHELMPLTGAEFAATGGHLFLEPTGERGIHVVAAEHEMIADADAPQHGAVGHRPRSAGLRTDCGGGDTYRR